MKVFEIPGFAEWERTLNAQYCASTPTKPTTPDKWFTRLELALFERAFESGRFTPIPLITRTGRAVLRRLPRLKQRLKK